MSSRTQPSEKVTAPAPTTPKSGTRSGPASSEKSVKKVYQPPSRKRNLVKEAKIREVAYWFYDQIRPWAFERDLPFEEIAPGRPDLTDWFLAETFLRAADFDVKVAKGLLADAVFVTYLERRIVVLENT